MDTSERVFLQVLDSRIYSFFIVDVRAKRNYVTFPTRSLYDDGTSGMGHGMGNAHVNVHGMVLHHFIEPCDNVGAFLCVCVCVCVWLMKGRSKILNDLFVNINFL